MISSAQIPLRSVPFAFPMDGCLHRRDLSYLSMTFGRSEVMARDSNVAINFTQLSVVFAGSAVHSFKNI